MKRPVKGKDGFYVIDDIKYPNLFGSREQVWNGNAYKTVGCLTKDQLLFNKWGRIVSKTKYHTAKKEKRLLQHGYSAKRGKFGYILTKKKRIKINK